MLLTAILAFAHVVSAIAWLGGGILFSFVIGPRLQKLSPASARDFIVTIVPGAVRFFQIVAAATVVFGLLLLFNMLGGDFSQFQTTWGTELAIGISAAFVAFVLAEAFTSPAFLRVVAAAREITPTNPPGPQFPGLIKRASMLGTVTVTVLLVTVVFMVAAGFY